MTPKLPITFYQHSSIKQLLKWLFLSSVFILAACQTIDPLPIQDYHLIRENPAKKQGQLVRLGGRVVAISSTDDSVKLEVMNVPLIFGQPDLRANTQGRFVASVNKQDLVDLGQNDITTLNGKIITVIGRVSGEIELYNIIDYFPTFVVDVKQYQFFDLKELALIQGLVEGKEHDLNALNLRLMSRVAELQFLKSFIPNQNANRSSPEQSVDSEPSMPNEQP